MKIKTLIVVCLLAITLISGSGCIDNSNETVQETGQEEMTGNLNTNSSDPVIETFLEEMTDRSDDSFNDTRETISVENFSDRSNALELEKQSAFSGYYNPNLTDSAN
ncbi:hypothetical protein MSSAC_0487 [Methanosarcina siciliae C2J]|uniref:Uncharacterized protein n=1 Tax=Methanosarcina siciliae C2J TaxID=1434118 RepID=A0A0E3PJ91_9EURY|nr:hypothetical protein [Methanosarcina siciliae]AKB35077.1 hypothetical protein MSSAC_0487 [Methanosarcina siciliae C2J]